MHGNALRDRFGAVVRQLRSERELSQEDFADLCELHRTYVGAIERGEKTVTIVTAQKLANALGLKMSELFRAVELIES